MPFKLPALEEFLAEHEKNFESYKKIGVLSKDMTWERQKELLRQEHKMLSKMDDTQRDVFVAERQRAHMGMLKSIQAQLGKMIEASKLRKQVQEDLADVRERVKFNRRKKSIDKNISR